VAVLWAVVLGALLKFVLNEGIARYQLATGETLLEGAVRRLGRTVPFVFAPYFLLWSFFVGSALMSACGVTMHAMLPIFDDPARGKIVFGIVHSAAGVVLVWRGGFALFERVMSVCIGVMFFVTLVTAALVCQNWSAVAKGLLTPTIPQADGSGLVWTMALIGGVGGTLTVLCYGYWIRELGRKGPEALGICRLDLGFAYTATALFGIAMVIIGSTIEVVEGGGATLVVNLANALGAPVGPIGKWAFLVGAWSAVFSSLLGVWQSVPYLFADFCGLVREREGGGKSVIDVKGRTYRGYLLALAIVPMLGLFVTFAQIQKLYAVLGALFLPMLAITLLILNGRSALVGSLRNRPLTVAVILGTLLVFAAFGYLELRRQFAE